MWVWLSISPGNTVAKVNFLCAGGNLHAPGRAEVADPVALNHNHLIARQLVGPAIEELPGTNDHRALSLNPQARAGEGESKRQTNEPTHLHQAVSESESR
jgi:hypothetical protein